MDWIVDTPYRYKRPHRTGLMFSALNGVSASLT